MPEDTPPLAVLDKNAGEEVRLVAQTYHGHDLLDMRVWMKDTGRPTKKGLMLRLEVIPDFIQALTSAYEKAKNKAPSKGGA